jgi:acyl-CoA oxidase
MATVFGQLIVDGISHGVHAILVHLRDSSHKLLPGISVEDCGYKIGLNGVDNGRIWFDQVRVPRTNLLNRFGDVDEDGKYTSPIEHAGKRFFTMLGTLVGGRVCVPRAGLSAAKAGLAIAINYGLRRRQFSAAPNLPETLLLDYPSHQRRLLPVLAKAYALDFALDWLNERYANRTPATMRELESQAAGMKAYATWYTTACLQECREACGGKGYLLANRIGQRRADTDIYTTFEGDNTVLSYLVARSLLSKFKQDFNEEGAFGVLRFIAGRVQDQFTALSPINVRKTDADHLRDFEFHLEALRFRENRMIYSLAQLIRRKIKEGMPSVEAFTLVQTHLKATAMAYIERLVLEQFQAKVADVQDEKLREVLSTLCRLFALEAIERHKGWFFEYDFLSAAKSKAIRREVELLCKEVRPHAAGLVDAFGIPGEVLGAQIV